MKPLHFKLDTLINKLDNYVLHFGCQFLMKGFFIGKEGELHKSVFLSCNTEKAAGIIHINNDLSFLERTETVKYSKGK